MMDVSRRDLMKLMALSPLLFAGDQALAVEGKAPDFNIRDLKNKSWRLSEILKSGPAVLSFWATWCRPCQAELPLLEGLWKEYEGKGVQFLAISVDAPRDKAQVKQTVHRLNLTMPIGLDPEGQVLSRYHPSRSLPYLVLVTKEGKIHQSYKGFSPDMVEKLQVQIDALLGGTSSEK